MKVVPREAKSKSTPVAISDTASRDDVMLDELKQIYRAPTGPYSSGISWIAFFAYACIFILIGVGIGMYLGIIICEKSGSTDVLYGNTILKKIFNLLQ
ncbi:MAG: hypothetical protein HYW78_04175 [Parcubacteria group bacterium]|nr:hypothetical protein [Parcubacteria group bacterium]